jgi:hypothetical protein
MLIIRNIGRYANVIYFRNLNFVMAWLLHLGH